MVDLYEQIEEAPTAKKGSRRWKFEPIHLWKANLEFRDETGVRGIEIEFISDNASTAYLDVFRWFIERNKAVPEWFGRLLAFKLYAFCPQRLDANGHIGPSTGFWAAEWKIDRHPWPEEVLRG